MTCFVHSWLHSSAIPSQIGVSIQPYVFSISRVSYSTLPDNLPHWSTTQALLKHTVSKRLGPNPGSFLLLPFESLPLGAALVLRWPTTSPVYVSQGWGVTLQSCLAVVLGCCERVDRGKGKGKLPVVMRVAEEIGRREVGEWMEEREKAR